MKRISLIILSLLFFATAFQSDKLLTSGWYIQSFPNMNGSSIMDITFVDTLTGCAVTNHDSSSGRCYILKTSNGGDNWNIVYTYNSGNNIYFNKIQFATDSIGYATVNYYPCFKTTNAGSNWFIVGNAAWGADDLAVINKDTLLSVNGSGLGGGVYRSTDGGANWQIIWGGVGSGMPKYLYMFDKNMGFHSSGTYVRKTTNGGFNWIDFSSGGGFTDIKFIDTLNGWKTNLGIQKTTDGGLTWINQLVPSTATNYYTSISILNKDTIWACGPPKLVNNKYFGIILKTTNGGLNWGYQFADTLSEHDGYSYIHFVNKNNGWAYPYFWGDTLYREIHTTVGGNNITYYLGIRHIPSTLPEKFSLGQNYPNPFNPTTNIPFELKEPSHVTLKVFDARGREVKELVNGRWGTGKFIADFDVRHGGSATIASGIYFYQIIVSGESTHQTFTETKRMLLIK